ncbi:MAG TPA: tetratricopeptide repeat protein [Planctomycetota bacterium]
MVHAETHAESGNDPCLQIQVDLSAMLDGELDAPSVRRVMVHSDVCPSCREFLDGIRNQVRLHRKIAAACVAEERVPARTGAEVAAAGTAGLRQQLTGNRLKLSKILYELGRCSVLMGLSPDFSREVAKEPMPVPDMAMRGRNLLDEVARSGSGRSGELGAEWVAARDLFDGQLRSPEENLSKGQRLLTECLALAPECYEARIYLGLVHHVRGQRAVARKQFQMVLSASSDRRVRGFALLNLGNIHLDEGDLDGAVDLLLQLVESGVVHEQPSLGTAYFNLGLAYGLTARFQESLAWFQRMETELPHKRAWMAREVGRRSYFLHLIRSNPQAHIVADAFPAWFASRTVGA